MSYLSFGIFPISLCRGPPDLFPRFLEGLYTLSRFQSEIQLHLSYNSCESQLKITQNHIFNQCRIILFSIGIPFEKLHSYHSK